ncbi:MAG: hypothetical protein ACXVZX_01535, partial [Terriglobales bacterium]
VKGGLAEIDTNRSDSRGVHAMILLVAQNHPTSGLTQAADHLINRDTTSNPWGVSKIWIVGGMA